MDPELKRILDMSYGFAAIERDIYYPARQRPENDAEHGYQLALLAWQIIEKDRLSLDAAKVFKLCLAHDLVELYAGDVPLWGATGHEGKQEREAKAFEKIRSELSADHDIPAAIAEYKARETEEAKFVYGLDKLAPFLNQLNTEGRVWKAHGVTMERAEEMLEKQALAAPQLTKYFRAAIAHMKAHRKRFFGGFTLIELLVVISIIALLASVVLASLNTARDKGRLGRARYFAAQVEHVAGEQPMAIWDFDECAASSTVDRSGNGYNGTFTTGISWNTDTPSNKGCSLAFNNTNSVTVSKVTTTGEGTNPFTISLWFKQASYQTRACFIGNANYTVGGWMFCQGYASTDGKLFFERAGSAGGDTNLSSATPFSLNVWVHGAAVYDGSKMYLYQDGTLVGSQSSVTSSGVAITPLRLAGTPQGGWGGYVGSIDEIRVYDKALTAYEVGALYAEGANRLKLTENRQAL